MSATDKKLLHLDPSFASQSNGSKITYITHQKKFVSQEEEEHHQSVRDVINQIRAIHGKKPESDDAIDWAANQIRPAHINALIEVADEICSDTKIEEPPTIKKFVFLVKRRYENHTNKRKNETVSNEQMEEKRKKDLEAFFASATKYFGHYPELIEPAKNDYEQDYPGLIKIMEKTAILGSDFYQRWLLAQLWINHTELERIWLTPEELDRFNANRKKSLANGYKRTPFRGMPKEPKPCTIYKEPKMHVAQKLSYSQHIARLGEKL